MTLAYTNISAFMRHALHTELTPTLCHYSRILPVHVLLHVAFASLLQFCAHETNLLWSLALLPCARSLIKYSQGQPAFQTTHPLYPLCILSLHCHAGYNTPFQVTCWTTTHKDILSIFAIHKLLAEEGICDHICPPPLPQLHRVEEPMSKHGGRKCGSF